MKGCFFLPGVAAVDDVIRSSAACAGEFDKKDGSGVKGVNQRPGYGLLRRVKLASRAIEPFEYI
jgi:hypothetical protein